MKITKLQLPGCKNCIAANQFDQSIFREHFPDLEYELRTYDSEIFDQPYYPLLELLYQDRTLYLPVYIFYLGDNEYQIFEFSGRGMGKWELGRFVNELKEERY